MKALIGLWVQKKPYQKCSLTNGNGDLMPNTIRLEVGDILYVTSMDAPKNYIHIITVTNASYYKQMSINTFLKMTKGFVRINRQYAIAVFSVTARYDWLYIWCGDNSFKISKKYRVSFQAECEKWFY